MALEPIDPLFSRKDAKDTDKIIRDLQTLIEELNKRLAEIEARLVAGGL